jgi:Short C-terminal domain
MPGLLRGVARVAVAAGTATAVSNRVSRRQANRWAAQDNNYVPAYMSPQPAPGAVQPPPPQPAPVQPQRSRVDELKELAELKTQGVLTEEEFAIQKARILA